MDDINKNLSLLRARTGKPFSTGLTAEQLKPFLQRADLLAACRAAVSEFDALSDQEQQLLKDDEEQVLPQLQAGFLNFYGANSVSPYLPLAAKGPWIVTAYGSVIYDTGGYGMLGHGHSPDFASALIAKERVMANIMTPSIQQLRFDQTIRSHVGRTRKDGCPFARFVSINSGSEAMSVATRISDLHARIKSDPGAVQEGKEIKVVALKGAFHGRTGRPARISNSSLKAYQNLASFRNYKDTLLVEPNNVDDLRRVFDEAESQNQYIEFMVLEPVMGEGNPGLAITPEFYRYARERTKAHGSLLIVDSIQAGLRARGELSIVDYPGFESLEAPDMETYAKAINAGQFPVSILAVSQNLVDLYTPGIYGNTMTANPRALALACSVLDNVTDEMRRNISARGGEFLQKLRALADKKPKHIIKVQGTGLLISAELEASIACVGRGSIEESMRRAGVNVIHGGKNALRFTPWFCINSEEIDVILETLEALL